MDDTLLMEELSPQGVLEQTFADEIITATARLRRCRLLEQNPDPDQQRAIDRDRAHAHNILRRSIAELRKLQTERALRLQPGCEDYPGLTDSRQVIATLKIQDKHRADSNKARGLDSFAGLMAQADRNLGMKTTHLSNQGTEDDGSSFCKSPATTSALTPRNAICPCGSGTKYKRCCGKDAPPVLNHASAQ